MDYVDQKRRRDNALARQQVLRELVESLDAARDNPPKMAKIEGRFAGWFGLTETVAQPDTNNVILRIGPGGTYERVFVGGAA